MLLQEYGHYDQHYSHTESARQWNGRAHGSHGQGCPAPVYERLPQLTVVGGSARHCARHQNAASQGHRAEPLPSVIQAVPRVRLDPVVALVSRRGQLGASS